MKEKNDEAKGRIDCVFAKIDENSIDNYNTEIYLIELKVDDGVIDGTNGINKHLIDIEDLKRNSRKFSDFIDRLETRIKYRRKMLEDKSIEIKINKQKIHFWTVIAISNETYAKKVAKKLVDLTKESVIKDEIKKGNLPEKCVALDKQIKQLKDGEVDVRFFFDKYLAKELSDIHLLEQRKLFEEQTEGQFLAEWAKNKII